MAKKNIKMLLNDEIKKWKNEKANSDVINQIQPNFIDSYFKTLLINFPKDSTWIHNSGNDKFSVISTCKWPSFSNSPNKSNEIISMNLIDQQTDDELWSEDKEVKVVDLLNIIIDCSSCSDMEDLKKIANKYLKFGKWIVTQNKYEIREFFGDDFLNNLEIVLSDNWKAFDRELKVFISFINIPDESINIRNLNLKSNLEQDFDKPNSVSFYFYNQEELYNLYEQCQNCQWPYVNAQEELKLTSKEVCLYSVPDKKLKGYMCNISAKSLANLYQSYKNALFSGNIRYYVKKGKGAKNVNDGIKSTIKDDSKRSLFYFYNNGVTFISPSVKILKDKIELNKFSIVNGGQTTYIIGTEIIPEDFTIPCKILEIQCDISSKLKNENEEQYNENLSTWLKYAGDISYALNSQKPVAQKDLITNKLTIRNLKQYYNSSPNREIIFLTKAGEDTFLAFEQKEKFVKLETYLSFVHCFFFQMPGFAKNQKSKMYQKENIKRVVGQDEDKECKKLFSPSQLFQVNIAKKQIDKVINKLSGEQKKNPDLYTEKQAEEIGLLRHCKNVVLSLYGLAYMFKINCEVFDVYTNSRALYNEFNKKYPMFVELQNEIFVSENLSNTTIWEESIRNLSKNIIYPAFIKWLDYRKAQGKIGADLSPRSFTIDDDYYYSYIVKSFRHLCNKNQKEFNRIFIDLLNWIK